MHKKLLVLLVGALTTGSVSSVATAASSWLVQPTVASQYMFRGVRLGGPSFQPTIEYDNGPAALGVWANFPINDKVVGQSDPEFDLYGSYTIDVTKDKLQFVPAFTVYMYPNAVKTNGFYKTTFEPSIALNYMVSGFKLTPKLYYDLVLKGPTAEFTAAYVIPAASLGSEFDLSATIGTFKWDSAFEDSSPDTKNWGDYWSAGVSLPFQVTSASKLTIGWVYTKGSANNFKVPGLPQVPNTAALGRGVVTIGYAMTF